jgi:hypothetical protein
MPNAEGAYGWPWYGDKAIQNFTESLPMSLEHLVIKDCSIAIFDCLAQGLDEGIPPKLKTVKVIFNPENEIEAPKRKWSTAGAELEKMASKCGVRLTRHERYE